MLKKKRLISIWAAVSLLFCCLCIGFATVNDQLNIFGNIFLDLNRTPILMPGDSFNEKINEYDAQTIVFDKYANQSAMIGSTGMTWDDGEDVQSSESPKGTIKLFYVEDTDTVYILSKEDAELIANPDCEGMFCPAENSQSSLRQIYFNSFDSSNTTNTKNMFNGCSALEKVYVKSEPDLAKVEESQGMFEGCYLLEGADGTRVYYGDTDSTTQPLDVTYARIDGNEGPGYYTDASFVITYFKSNELDVAENEARYEIKGNMTWFSLANGNDSTVYSEEDIEYQIATYYHDGNGWVIDSIDKGYSFEGGEYCTRKFSVSARSESENRIKVVATCLTGQVRSIQAEYIFDILAYNVEYSYDGGAIRLTVDTNTDSGEFEFEWDSRLMAYTHDDAGIFAGVSSEATAHEGTLNANTRYEFFFLVKQDNKELYDALESDSSYASSLVSVTKK